MSSSVKAFLEAEITPIPQIMERFIGKYYNNALYNGITWMVFILHILRFVFDLTVNALLKKMRFKEYVRIRLRKSLWYLGFYTCSLMYCLATIWKNNLNMNAIRHKFQILDLTEPISGHLILGYVLLCSFYVSSSMWEGLQCSVQSFSYLFLTGFVAFTYFLRYIELTILFTSIFSGIHMFTEFCRCLFCVLKKDLSLLDWIVKGEFALSIMLFIVSYFGIIPIKFILPLARGFLKNPNSIILAGLNITIWGWLICELYSSPLFRLIQHHWHCSKKDKVPECLGTRMECALFLPRDDVAYNLNIIRQEIKEREARLMALRKPKKSANMLVQTLKCVAAINRKIKYRRLLEKVALASTSESGPDELNERQMSALSDEEMEEVEQSSIFGNETEIPLTKVAEEVWEKNENGSLAKSKQSENSLKSLKSDLKVQFIGIVEEDRSDQMDNGDEKKQSKNSNEINKFKDLSEKKQP